jgi:hypothetical protein
VVVCARSSRGVAGAEYRRKEDAVHHLQTSNATAHLVRMRSQNLAFTTERNHPPAFY